MKTQGKKKFSHLLSLLAVTLISFSCEQLDNQGASSKISHDQSDSSLASAERDISDSSSSQEIEILKERVENLYDDVQYLIDIPDCNVDSNCAALSLGQIECGGPQAYIIASKLVTDLQDLQLKVTEYDQALSAYNDARKSFSHCMILPEAIPACIENRCTNSNGVLVGGSVPESDSAAQAPADGVD